MSLGNSLDFSAPSEFQSAMYAWSCKLTINTYFLNVVYHQSVTESAPRQRLKADLLFPS